jgi:large-conductance mechanosensitive channel
LEFSEVPYVVPPEGRKRFSLPLSEEFLEGSLIDLQKGGTNMVTKEKKQNAAKHGDFLILVVSCVILAWIIFLGLVTQAR